MRALVQWEQSWDRAPVQPKVGLGAVSQGLWCSPCRRTWTYTTRLLQPLLPKLLSFLYPRGNPILPGQGSWSWLLVPARGRVFWGAGWDLGAVSGPWDPSLRVCEAAAASRGGNEQQRDGASEELPKESEVFRMRQSCCGVRSRYLISWDFSPDLQPACLCSGSSERCLQVPLFGL